MGEPNHSVGGLQSNQSIDLSADAKFPKKNNSHLEASPANDQNDAQRTRDPWGEYERFPYVPLAFFCVTLISRRYFFGSPASPEVLSNEIGKLAGTRQTPTSVLSLKGGGTVSYSSSHGGELK